MEENQREGVNGKEGGRPGKREPAERSRKKQRQQTFSAGYVHAVLHNCASQDCPSYIPILANDFINTLFLYLESQPPKHM